MAATRQIRWSPEAEQDLLEIWDYIAREASAGTADRQLRTIDQVAVTLCEWPRSGRLRDELLPDVRSVVASPYVIFYRVTERTIEIVRVLHGRRDIDAIFAKE